MVVCMVIFVALSPDYLRVKDHSLQVMPRSLTFNLEHLRRFQLIIHPEQLLSPELMEFMQFVFRVERSADFSHQNFGLFAVSLSRLLILDGCNICFPWNFPPIATETALISYNYTAGDFIGV